MAKTIYVGNVPYKSTEEEVRTIFEEFGTVHSVRLITDRETGRPRGFGFVEMDDESADKAIEELDGKELDGRNLKISEAVRKDRSRSFRGNDSHR